MTEPFLQAQPNEVRGLQLARRRCETGQMLWRLFMAATAAAAAAVTSTLSRLPNYCRRRRTACTGWKQRDLSARISGTKSIYRSTTKATALGDLSLLLNSKFLNSHLVSV